MNAQTKTAPPDVVWRFLPFVERDVAAQMAIDTELAALCEAEQNVAYVRLYRMSPPGITIGRNQKWRAVIDPSECDRRGWNWARRPTGGGALLHLSEINYAVIAPRHHLDPSRSASFRPAFERILQGLSKVISQLGLNPVICLGRGGEGTSAVGAHGLCAQSLTRFEITVEGRKAVASAHRNLSCAILQHGTLYMSAPTDRDRFWPDDNDRPPTSSQPRWFAFGPHLGQHSRTPDALRTLFQEAFENTLRVNFEIAASLPTREETIQNRLELWMKEGWRTLR